MAYPEPAYTQIQRTKVMLSFILQLCCPLFYTSTTMLDWSVGECMVSVHNIKDGIREPTQAIPKGTMDTIKLKC